MLDRDMTVELTLAAKERLIRRGFQVADWIEPRFLDVALQQKQAVQAAR